MGSGDQAETAPFKPCRACGAEIRERDRFCRRCGAGQSGRLASASTRLDRPERIQAASGDQSALT
jgi:predicted amidophosphoribosyltransferase